MTEVVGFLGLSKSNVSFFAFFSEAHGHTFILFIFVFCHNSEFRRRFWTIFGHSEPLEPLELPNRSRDLRSSKETQTSSKQVKLF